MIWRACVFLLAGAMLATIGCGGGSGTAPTASKATPSADPVKKQQASTSEAYDSAKFKASLKGVVSYEGEQPKRSQIDTSGDKACHAVHAAEPLLKEDLPLVKDGKLANVLIYLKTGTEKFSYETPATPVVVDQKGCRYVPHVLGVMVEQPLQITNSDALAHNVHGLSPIKSGNPDFNKSQPNAGSRDTVKLPYAEVGYIIQCDVHKWMKVKVGVFEHPFFAVTREDGSYEIANVPPGEYEVEAWHETLKTQSGKATIKEDGAVELNFVFKK